MSHRKLGAVAPRQKMDTTAKYTAQLRSLQQQAAALSCMMEQLEEENIRQKVVAFVSLHQETILNIYQHYDKGGAVPFSPLLADSDCTPEIQAIVMTEFPLLRVLSELQLEQWKYVGSMSMSEFCYTWTGYMQELALLLNCRERCPKEDTDNLILASVGKCLHLGRAVSLLSPRIVDQLMDLNLITGQYRPPSESYWQEAAASICLSKPQLIQLQELMRIVGPKYAAVNEQRGLLISQFVNGRAAPTAASVQTTSAAAAAAEAAAQQEQDQQQQQQQPERQLLLPLLISSGSSDIEKLELSPALGEVTAESDSTACVGKQFATAETGNVAQQNRGFQHSSMYTAPSAGGTEQVSPAAAAAAAAAPAAAGGGASDGAACPDLAKLMAAVASSEASGNDYSSWQDLPWVTRDLVNQLDNIMGQWRVLSKLIGSSAYMLSPVQMARLMVQCFPYYPIPVQVIDGILRAAKLKP